MRSKLAGLGALTAMAAACSAMAQPAPKDQTPAAVAAWIKANIRPGPYAWLETTDKHVAYYALDDLDPADARVRAWVRDESFVEAKGPFGAYRSTSMLLEVDCPAKRSRVVAMDWYPLLNLKGPRASQDAPNARWNYESRPEARFERVFGEACKAKLDALGPAKPSVFR